MNRSDFTHQRVIRKKSGEHQRYASGFSYQKDSGYFAQIADNLIDEGVKELENLGADRIDPCHSGIHFHAEKAAFYRINYMTRLVSRILAPLHTFPCPDSDTLYRSAKKIRWSNLMTLKKSFSIVSNVSNSNIDHSHFAGLRLKDAIVDHFRELTGRRPNVDTLKPQIIINLHIRENIADVSVDASGGSLHKRGYREESVSAPMQENLAAAVIRYSGWDGSVPIYDPMCGSGTLLCEALMLNCMIPAGIFREKFGFEMLPDHNPDIWHQVKKEADSNVRPPGPGSISGSDISETSVNASRTNLMGIHHGGDVTVTKTAFQDIVSIENSIIVANPPYGIRMGRDQDMQRLHADFGDFLKQRCRGSQAYIYFGDPDHIKSMGLKPSWKIPMKAGGLDGRLVKYELY
ncbi:MAG: class I SAM-dependent RNA methyltransferase [Desulfamplus sp.]|nr:class I SAM-dependent RNA methyltransferase [Desulfamplus sp.]